MFAVLTLLWNRLNVSAPLDTLTVQLDSKLLMGFERANLSRSLRHRLRCHCSACNGSWRRRPSWLWSWDPAPVCIYIRPPNTLTSCLIFHTVRSILRRVVVARAIKPDSDGEDQNWQLHQLFGFPRVFSYQLLLKIRRWTEKRDAAWTKIGSTFCVTGLDPQAKHAIFPPLPLFVLLRKTNSTSISRSFVAASECEKTHPWRHEMRINDLLLCSNRTILFD